jgi:propionyl-CoA carboxylase alpha chain
MFYDPMIAKLITYGRNRNEAIEKMLGAIDQYVITGVSHNLNFLSSIMQNETFQSGYTTTNFIEEQYQDGFKGEQATSEERELVAALLTAYHTSRLKRMISYQDLPNHWTISIHGEQIEVLIKESKSSLIAVIGSREFDVNLNALPNDPRVRCEINDDEFHMQIMYSSPGYQLIYRGKIFNALVTRQRTAKLNELMPEKVPLDLSQFLISPMPGLLMKVCVDEGQSIKAGEELAIVEAMKMENSLRATKDVKIKSILASEGANLAVDQKILEFED